MSAESENIIGLGESPELSIAAEEIETLAIPTAQEKCAELMKENRKLKNSVKTLREIIVKRRADLRKYQTKGKNTTCSTWAIVVTPVSIEYYLSLHLVIL